MDTNATTTPVITLTYIPNAKKVDVWALLVKRGCFVQHHYMDRNIIAEDEAKAKAEEILGEPVTWTAKYATVFTGAVAVREEVSA